MRIEFVIFGAATVAAVTLAATVTLVPDGPRATARPVACTGPAAIEFRCYERRCARWTPSSAATATSAPRATS